MLKGPRVVLLCQDGLSSRAVFGALHSKYPNLLTLLEDPISRTRFLRRRIKKLGLTEVLGQILLKAAIVPVLRRRSDHRIEEIREMYGLSEASIEGPGVVRVPSVNTRFVQETLRRANPNVVVVNGTRVISTTTLKSVDAPFINIHHGITPAYRGVYGGYWALIEGRPDLVGSTIHYVDKGIDTGAVIRQMYFQVTATDNITTYPFLHIGTALPALLEVVDNLSTTGICSCEKPPKLDSRLRTHPTAWSYFRGWKQKGVR